LLQFFEPALFFMGRYLDITECKSVLKKELTPAYKGTVNEAEVSGTVFILSHHVQTTDIHGEIECRLS
jgi:hypothetical protein